MNLAPIRMKNQVYRSESFSLPQLKEVKKEESIQNTQEQVLNSIKLENPNKKENTQKESSKIKRLSPEKMKKQGLNLMILK